MAGPTTAERGREVRLRLLDAAAELIPERGWGGVSTRLLAERAGVRPGLVHYHFASLQALLREAAVATVRALLEEMETLLDRAGPPETALDLMLERLDQHTGRDPVSALFSEAYLTATRDPELGAALAELLAEFNTRVASWLARHGAPTPERTAAVLAAALDGVMLHRALNPGLDAATVAPVLRRLLSPAASDESR